MYIKSFNRKSHFNKIIFAQIFSQNINDMKLFQKELKLQKISSLLYLVHKILKEFTDDFQKGIKNII